MEDNIRAEEIKNKELKEPKLAEEDLEQVSGGGAIYNASPDEAGIGGGSKSSPKGFREEID